MTLYQAVDSVTGQLYVYQDTYTGPNDPTNVLVLDTVSGAGAGTLSQAVDSVTGEAYTYQGIYPGPNDPTNVLVLDTVSRTLSAALWQSVDSGTGATYIYQGEYTGPNDPTNTIQLVPTAGVRPAMWLTNRDDGTVSRIAIDTGLEYGSPITVGSLPAGIAWDGGSSIWVANSGDDTVSCIDRTTGLVTDTISVGTTPTDVAWDHAGHIYVACGGNNTVHRISTTTRLVDLVISIECGNGMCWDGADHMHTVNAAAWSLSRIRIDTGALDGHLVGAPQVRAIVWDHNGYVWYAKQTPDATQRLSIDSYSYVGEMPSSPYALSMAWEDTGHMWASHASGVVVQENVVSFATVVSVTVTASNAIGRLAWDGGDYVYICDTRVSAEAGANRVARVHRTTHEVTSVTITGASGAGRVGCWDICSDAVVV